MATNYISLFNINVGSTAYPDIYSNFLSQLTTDMAQVVTLTETQQLSNKTVASPVLSGTVTGTYTLASPVLSGTVTGTYTLGGTPTLPVSVVTLTGNQQLSNKTLPSPVLSGTVTGTYTLGGTPTFPASVVTLTGTQTLTNKTLTSPTINLAAITSSGDLPIAQGGTGASTEADARSNLGLGTAAVDNSATANTANTVVLRDGSGNFAAGTITANLTGTASTVANATSTVSGGVKARISGTSLFITFNGATA